MLKLAIYFIFSLYLIFFTLEFTFSDPNSFRRLFVTSHYVNFQLETQYILDTVLNYVY